MAPRKLVMVSFPMCRVATNMQLNVKVAQSTVSVSTNAIASALRPVTRRCFGGSSDVATHTTMTATTVTPATTITSVRSTPSFAPRPVNPRTHWTAVVTLAVTAAIAFFASVLMLSLIAR
jgi:hypothetical protein